MDVAAKGVEGGEQCLWRDNGFAQHLIAELLGSVFGGVDARVAGEVLHHNAGALAPTGRQLFALERQQCAASGTAQAHVQAGDEDDLFAFVSMADEADESGSRDDLKEEEEQEEDRAALELRLGAVEPSALPRTVEAFLAAEPLLRAATFFSSASSPSSSSSSSPLHEVRRALFADMERLHGEASPHALSLVWAFLAALAGFVAKEPHSVVDSAAVHPPHFKRLLLTALPWSPANTGREASRDERDEAAIDCGLLHCLLALAFSFSDETRIRAVELLVMLARVPYPRSPSSRASCLAERPTHLQTKTTALAIYDAAYSVDRWAPALGSHTFRTLTFPMRLREAEALVHHYQALHLGTQLLDEHSRVLEELADKLQSVIQSPEFGGRAFVKISTRSPKDVVFHLPKFELTLRQVTEEWTALYNLPDPMPESVEQAIMQRCGALCLSVTSGAEAVDMLKTSKRIWVDLKEALDTPSDDFAIKLVVREWLDIPNVFELRGFVRNRRLTALSQYFSMCYFPWVSPAQWADVKTRVLSFFETTVAELLPVEDCVCDFVVCEDRVMVIELNLFGRTAGAALFSWDTDQQLLYGNRPFEFRVVADASLSATVV